VPEGRLLRKPFTFSAIANKVRECVAPGVSRRPPCILLVEDDELVRSAIVGALEDIGFSVEEAGTGAEALAKAQARSAHLDAAIVDLRLPDRTGEDVAAELRLMSATLPIIVASGYCDDRVRERIARDKLISFLGKPYDAEKLSEVLRGFGVSA
jgi:CheY-like chemotaxis protein